MKLLLRILLSPFIFIYACFILFAGTIFPLSIILPIALINLISIPFIWLLNRSGTNIEYPETIFS